MAINLEADLLDVVRNHVSPNRSNEVVKSLLRQGVRGEGSRLLLMLLLLSIVRSKEVRTHAAEAGEFSLEWRAGGSGSQGFGGPIYRLVS